MKGAILAKPMDSPGLWIDPPRIRMSKDEFLLLRVDQSPGDIEVQVYAPDGELILSRDTQNSSYGPEDVPVVAQQDGVYRFEGKPDPALHPHRHLYEVLLRRHALPADREHFRAAGLLWRGREEQELPERIRLLTEAAAAWGGIGDLRGEADTSYWLAKALDDMEKGGQARERFERARDLYRALNDRVQLLPTLQNLAELQRAASDLQGNRRTLEEALKIVDDKSDHRARATLLQGLGMNLIDSGEPERALRPLEEGLALLRSIQDRPQSVELLNALGRAYLSLGAYEEAGKYHWEALIRLDRKRDSRVRAMTFHHLGDVFREAGLPREAIVRYQWSLLIWDEIGDQGEAGKTFNNQAGAFLQAGDRASALRSLNRATVLFDLAERPVDSAQALVNAAWIYSDQKQPHQARATLDEASRKLAGREPPAKLVAFLHLTRARTFLQLRRFDEAAGEAETALQIVEERRNRIQREDLRVSFSPEIHGYFDLAIQTLMEKHSQELAGGWDRKAFEFSERARARSLLDSMQGEPVQPRIDIDTVQRELGEDTALLEIFLGEQSSYLWEVTRNGFRSVPLPGRRLLQRLASSVAVGIARSDTLTDLAPLYRQTRDLSTRLLSRLGHLPSQSRLVFVVPPELQSVPFAALPNPFSRLGEGDPSTWSNPLIRERSVVSVPSMAVLAAQRERLAGASPFGAGIAAFVAPRYVRPGVSGSGGETPLSCRDGESLIPLGELGPLKAGHRELGSIKSFAGRVPVRAWVGADASVERALQSRFGPIRYLYFSAHGHLDTEDANRSAIVLSAFDAAGRPVQPCLFARDIASLSLPVDLVVVSSCSSGLGRPVRGEGVLGLGQAFLKAGAKRVGLTLWDVQEGPTASLMEAFHRRWLGEGQSPVEALREAQLELLGQPATSSPAYWGGFFLLGDWQ